MLRRYVAKLQWQIQFDELLLSRLSRLVKSHGLLLTAALSEPTYCLINGHTEAGLVLLSTIQGHECGTIVKQAFHFQTWPASSSLNV